MKKIFTVLFCILIIFGLTGCSNEENKQNIQQESNEKAEKSIDDFTTAKAKADEIVGNLNDKIEDKYKYEKFIDSDEWLHIVYSNSTPVSFEVDFKVDETFHGITIDNNSTDQINEGFRLLPITVANLEVFKISEKDMNGIIDLLSDMEKEEYKGENINVLDNKSLNIFGISLK